jgi:hypothetical protein
LGSSWAVTNKILVDKKTNKIMNAVCSVCQKTVIDGATAVNNEKSFVVMTSHEDLSGNECEGTGTTPEVVFEENLTDTKN